MGGFGAFDSADDIFDRLAAEECACFAVSDDIERAGFAIGDNRCAGSQGFYGNDTKIFLGGVDEAFGGIERRFQGGV